MKENSVKHHEKIVEFHKTMKHWEMARNDRKWSEMVWEMSQNATKQVEISFKVNLEYVKSLLLYFMF